jgi:putative peptide maturation dehydrogenase
MTLIRRTKYLFFYFDNAPFLDIELLLRGQAKLVTDRQVYALSLLRSDEYPVAVSELEPLFRIPTDGWSAESEICHEGPLDVRRIHELCHQGILIANIDDNPYRELRERDEKLSNSQWHIYGALYHFMTRWRDVDVRADFTSRIDQEKRARETTAPIEVFVRTYGKPPDVWHRVHNPLGVVDLPIAKQSGGLFECLEKRRTTRAFDENVPLSQEMLSVLVYYAFGCHGYLPITEDIGALKKTSPSGGCLHPIEVYILVLNVQGLGPGVYHYNIKDHSLELMIALDRQQAVEWGNEFTAGQSFPRRAQALFILTARFYRNFWKYRKHQKAYGVILMDAAHLSQTFYLLCAELGLGCFITAAINGMNVEQRLGLDGFTEGAIAICGCGEPAEQNDIDPVFRPYVPRSGPPLGSF